MKNLQRFFSISLAVCMTAGFASYLPITANAAAYNWDARPAWTPHDFVSAMDFMNKYGSTHSENNTICIVKHVPDGMRLTADIKAENSQPQERTDADYESKIFTFEFEMPNDAAVSNNKEKDYEKSALQRYIDFHGYTDSSFVGYHYEALIINADLNTKFTIMTNIAEKANSFSEDGASVYTFENGNETDIFGWLPDSYPEYTEFVNKNGNLSLHEGKLVYCHDINYSTGAVLDTKQTGTGKLKCTSDISTYNEMVMKAAGNTSHLVQVYEGDKAGEVSISFDANIPWAPEEHKLPVQTASVYVNDDMTVSSSKNELPDWIPHDQDSLIDFLDKHGKTWVQDGIICCARQIHEMISTRYTYSFSGSAAENIKDYVIFSERISPDSEVPSLVYEVTAYRIPNGTDLDISFNYGSSQKKINASFAFEKDSSGHITQKDIYSWLPDSDEEFNDYYKKHGDFSIQNGYIVYCTSIPASSGYNLYLHQNGTGTVSEYHEEVSAPAKDITRDGGTMHFVKLYKPLNEGTVRLDILKANKDTDVLPSDGVDTAYFRIDKDMNITAAEKSDMKTTVKGDCNGDGIIGISDAVALQNWLLGREVLSENGEADINEDNVVDVFDLIALKSKIMDIMSEAPKPVMAVINQNYAWLPVQKVQIYDQYGTVYRYSNSVSSEQNRKDFNDVILKMESDDWYEQIQNIMDSAAENTLEQVKSNSSYCIKSIYCINDRLINSIAGFSEKAEKYSKKPLFKVNVADDMGATTVYIIGKTSNKKPVYSAIAEYGDYSGCIDDKDVKTFIHMLIDNKIASPLILQAMSEKKYSY